MRSWDDGCCGGGGVGVRALRRGGCDGDAVIALKRALQLDPTYPGAHLRLGEAFLRRGETYEARRHLRAELLLRPDEPAALMELANHLLDVGETRAAVACLKRLVAL